MNGLVIGVGNRFRSDDGVGPAVADEFRRLDLPNVDVMTSIGEPGTLIDAWTGAGHTVVVDATAGPLSVPGRVRRWSPDEVAATTTTSSHAFGVLRTYALGTALGRVPESLALVTIDVAETGHGLDLSAPVLAAVPEVVDAVLAEFNVHRRGDFRPVVGD